MSTYLRLLYIAFWMLPAQRVCTMLGLGFMAGLGGTLYSPTQLTAWLAGGGFAVALALPLLLGGAFWRALSAPRVLSLAPHGRLRLLLGVLAVAVTISLSSVVFGALYSLALPSEFHSLRGLSLLVGLFRPVLAVLAQSAPWIGLWLIACFVVSRSPLAMLLSLIACVVTVYLLWRFDFIDDSPKNPRARLMEQWNFVLPLAAWVLFAAWYLLARRIRPPGWLLPGGQSMLAAVALAEPSTRIPARHTALQRLLLGGSSVPRLLIQWLLVYGVLLLLLKLMALQGDDEARGVAHVVFAALILFPAIVAAQAVAIVRRARALWLASGFTRPQLYTLVGRTLLKFTLGMAMLFAALLLLLWNTQPWHPALTVTQVLVLSLLPGSFAAMCALCRPGGQPFYWPAVVLVLWFAAWCPLTGAFTASWSGTSGLLCNALVVAVIFIQLALAPGRWQVEDLPRSSTSR